MSLQCNNPLSIKKLLLRVLKVAVILMVVFLLTIWSPWIFMGCMAILEPAPPAPQETYGEFPFELTYKINGEIITVKDIYVCEYAGVGWSEAGGKYRKWSGYIKGCGESAIFITEDSDRKIFCFVGDAEFYMNDEQYPEERPLTPRLYDVKKNVNVMNSLNQDEIVAIYNIEIVSWKFSKPIENSFE